jgi:hypothetical protein
MFTLKLFRSEEGITRTKIVSVHHVETETIGPDKKTIRIMAYNSSNGGDYRDYYVGEYKEEYDAIDKRDHYGWGLLENLSGRTSEHFRPHNYGF